MMVMSLSVRFFLQITIIIPDCQQQPNMKSELTIMSLRVKVKFLLHAHT